MKSCFHIWYNAIKTIIGENILMTGKIKVKDIDVRGVAGMKSLEEIKLIIADHMDILNSQYKVKEIGVFGSYVRD
jgi:hypothetical protein